MDFKRTLEEIKPRAQGLLRELFPQGVIEGREYCVGSLDGEPGRSLKVNLDTLVWKDFASSGKGGDFISLYAAKMGITQSEAALKLGGMPSSPVKKPNFTHYQLGKPSHVWEYRDSENRETIMYHARYDTDKGKEFRPFYFTEGKWKSSFPSVRPLYGLEELKKRPDAPILIVEGEKAADAARKMCEPYIVVTWPGGAQAINKVDFSPLYGRKKVLLWPDGDEPGKDAMSAVSHKLGPHVGEIKYINTDKNSGWDAADALEEGWGSNEWRAWAKELATVCPKLEAPQKVVAELVTEKNVTVEVPEEIMMMVKADIDKFKSLGVILGAKLKPINNEANALQILKNWDESPQVWFDEFHVKLFTMTDDGVKREWTDTDLVQLLVKIQRKLKFHNLTKTQLKHAVIDFAYQNKRNEVKEWVKSLEWDGKGRIEEFFTECFGADDNEYVRAVSKSFWVGMVARIMRPGCKLDTMVVLEGGQGKKKSTALGIIGGEWFAETHEDPSNKDFFLNMQGKLIMEIAELDSFSRAETTTIKRLLSCQVDRFRVPYGEVAQDFPRKSIFVGTTNEQGYLKDTTGNRRFWPIRTGEIHIETIAHFREMYFAEALRAFEQGATWWEVPIELAKKEQDTRRQADEWESIVKEHLERTTEKSVRLFDVADRALGIRKCDLSMMYQKRIANCMRLAGWDKDHGRKGNFWEKTGHTGHTKVNDSNNYEPVNPVNRIS